MSDSLLLNFRDARTQTGTDRNTLKQVADKLGCSETMATHMAINRLYRDLFVGDVEFDLPTPEQIQSMDRSQQAQGGRVVDDIKDHL